MFFNYTQLESGSNLPKPLQGKCLVKGVSVTVHQLRTPHFNLCKWATDCSRWENSSTCKNSKVLFQIDRIMNRKQSPSFGGLCEARAGCIFSIGVVCLVSREHSKSHPGADQNNRSETVWARWSRTASKWTLQQESDSYLNQPKGRDWIIIVIHSKSY